MKTVSYTCDHCGTTEFKRYCGNFERALVNVKFDLYGQYVSDLDRYAYDIMSADLCPKCAAELYQMVKNFVKKNK